MSETSVPDALIHAYQSTSYRVVSCRDPFILRVGVPSKALSELFQESGCRSAVFITADNPFGQMLSAKANAMRQERLANRLAALTEHVLEGEGQGDDKTWPPETSFLALGIGRDQACALGSQFEQNAIVWADEDAIPELILLR